MKKSLTALALALALVETLAACSTDKNPNGTTASGNNDTTGTTSGTTGGATSGSAGQVARRYNLYDNQGRDYFYDGRYTAGSNGQVYGSDGSTLSRDLTQGARDIVRGTGDAVEDIGRGIGNAARDITGDYSGTPSWEPDSSAVRY